jgi:hypothetical protein
VATNSGRLANPSSFHHPFVRLMRRVIKDEVMKMMKEFTLEGYRLESLFDSLCIHGKGLGIPPMKSWHQETYTDKYSDRNEMIPPIKDTDFMFSGWLNCDVHTTQLFHCIPGSHHIHAKMAVDFSSMDCLQLGVPPGCLLVYDQRIIQKRPQERLTANPSYRFYATHRLTKDTLPLMHEYIQAWVVKQGVPRIRVGEKPAMFSVSHFTSVHFPRSLLRSWCERTFHPNVLSVMQDSLPTHVVTFSVPTANKQDRTMTSLYDYGLPMYIPYSEKDLLALWPEVL